MREAAISIELGKIKVFALCRNKKRSKQQNYQDKMTHHIRFDQAIFPGQTKASLVPI